MLMLSTFLANAAFGIGFAVLTLLVLLYVTGTHTISESDSQSYDKSSQPMLPTPL
jgi:hypothetical protein